MRPTRASEAIAAWLRGGSGEERRNQMILARRLSVHLGRRVNQGTVSNLSRGRHIPRGDMIVALHAELGIKPEWWSEATPNTTAAMMSGGRDWLTVRAHPATNLFPLATDADLRELAADIRANGLRSPIVVTKTDGEIEILDGRNRLLACKLAGIAPTYIFWHGADPIAFVVSANLKRRHLTNGQRGELGAEIARLYAGEAKRRGRNDYEDPAAIRRRGRPRIHRLVKQDPENTSAPVNASAESTSLAETSPITPGDP